MSHRTPTIPHATDCRCTSCTPPTHLLLTEWPEPPQPATPTLKAIPPAPSR